LKRGIEIDGGERMEKEHKKKRISPIRDVQV